MLAPWGGACLVTAQVELPRVTGLELSPPSAVVAPNHFGVNYLKAPRAIDPLFVSYIAVWDDASHSPVFTDEEVIVLAP